MKIREEQLLDLIINSSGVSIDSRTLKPNEIFFALVGDNFDGNSYIKTALSQGAKYAVSSDMRFEDHENVILVYDTLKTLQNVANLYRKKFNIPIIAITGTNGKTTTKELIYSVLSTKYNVLKTIGNFNNHIGVPLTLLNLKPENEIAVIEMGASGQGEIDALCKIAVPTHGLITSIGKAHLEGFGNEENIIKTKSELFHYLKNSSGVFFLNSDIKSLEHLQDKNLTWDGLQIFSGEEINGKLIKKAEKISNYMNLEIMITGNDLKTHNINTQIYGIYNLDNIFNALKVGDYFNLSIDSIKLSLESYKAENNRSQISNWKNNVLILDAYNANPTSMAEAINSFVNLNSNSKKAMILGDMLELGEIEENEHYKILNKILNFTDFEFIYLVGNIFFSFKDNAEFKYSNMSFFKNSSDVINNINTKQKLTILVKGSRGIKLETIFL